MASETANPWIDVIVSDRRELASGQIALELRRADDGPLPAFAAGAHVDLRVTDEITRQYSLCNEPGETGFYRLGVLADPQSRGGSLAVHRHFHPGWRTRISAPKNHFPLAEDAPLSILVAGGIGVTPLLAMARRLRRLGRAFAYHYCARSADLAGFAQELRASFPKEFQLHCDDGAPGQKFDPGPVFSTARDQAHVYVCGPSGFMNWVIEAAEKAGLPPERIHREYFQAKAIRPATLSNSSPGAPA